jgi:hypothetical protein
MTSARAELFPFAHFIFGLEREFLTSHRVFFAETVLSTTNALHHPLVTREKGIMRPNFHIELSKSEQAYIAMWKRRVLAVYGFAAMTLLAAVLFQHLFEQNTGNLARNEPPALAENTGRAAPH